MRLKKNKEDIVFDKEKLIMKKEMEKKEILRERKDKKNSPQYKSELWKAIEANTEFNVNNYELQGEIKDLKEQCVIDNEAEVQEIITAIKPM